MKNLKPLERDINAGIITILELDDWHVFKMETLWRDDWKKGTGEPGMPDLLAIRYLRGHKISCSHGSLIVLKPPAAEVLFIEGKRPGGKVEPHQRSWIEAERARGALVWLAGEDFPASVDGFIAHYKESGLCRRQID